MKTSSGGRTCRNTACEKYKKPEDKPEVKSEAAKLTPKPKSRSGRCPKHYLDRLKSLEVKHLKTEELEPLELDLDTGIVRCVRFVVGDHITLDVVGTVWRVR